MAEILGKKNGAAATDRSFGDQGIEPAELLANRQLVGIEDQVGVGAHHLKAGQGLQ